MSQGISTGEMADNPNPSPHAYDKGRADAISRTAGTSGPAFRARGRSPREFPPAVPAWGTP